MIRKGSKRITLTVDDEVYNFICSFVGCTAMITDKNDVSESYTFSSKSDVVNKIFGHLARNEISR